MGIQASIYPGSHGDRIDIKLDLLQQLCWGIASHDIYAVRRTRNPLSGIAGWLSFTRENLFGGGEKFNVFLEKGTTDSNYQATLMQPSVHGAGQQSITILNSVTPATSVHGIVTSSSGSAYGDVRMCRFTAKMDQKWELNSNLSKTAGIMIEQIVPLGDHGRPIFTDRYGCPITFSGNLYDKMLVAKLKTEYTKSNDQNLFQYNIQLEQGLPISPGWLFFYRLRAHVKQGFKLGPSFALSSLSGGTVIGNLAPHDAFPIGGTNSVRGYGEGAVGTGRSFLLSSSELLFPLICGLQGTVFADLGTDCGSGRSVLGDPAGIRGRRGTGFGYGVGIQAESAAGPIRIDYAVNDMHGKCVYFGFGYPE
ncbi:hypothetical protein SUGI_0977630 [Cryptomeria japonica]|uniref:outer envelope protein 39, chloroplastic isoform X2 n=1 Tax=Cryptomeria japonica TaxID=3369 RepID=UPI002414A42F|nr:outer envelope protein 39, chloroplastic isoform X2 [Cryptomeria japonica]GLJ46385.1 hypothetical protein SUGI_0977630 [Cryptomeria japonica]